MHGRQKLHSKSIYFQICLIVIKLKYNRVVKNDIITNFLFVFIFASVFRNIVIYTINFFSMLPTSVYAI